MATMIDAGSTVGKLVLGFVAGALAVLVFHQLALLVLGMVGMLPNAPNLWSLKPNQIGVPQILNQMFWGGLWGCAYPFVKDRLPGPLILTGFLFGLLGPTLIGNWIVLPLIRSTPMFANFVPMGLLRGALINGTFGIGIALLFPQIAKRLG